MEVASSSHSSYIPSLDDLPCALINKIAAYAGVWKANSANNDDIRHYTMLDASSNIRRTLVCGNRTPNRWLIDLKIARDGWREALLCASRYGRHDICQELLHPDIAPDLSQFHVKNALNNALVEASIEGHDNICHMLLGIGADASDFDSEALARAAERGHIEVCRLLIENGANVHDGYNQALMYAARNGYIDVCRLLKECGANATDARVLNNAIRGGHIEVCRFLLESGVDINSTFKMNWLVGAAHGGCVEISRMLLDHGVGTGDMYLYIRNSALRRAASNGHIDVCRLLIEYGTNQHDVALVEAASNGHIDVCRLLIEHGTNQHDIALAKAASNGHIDVCRLLIEHGAGVDECHDECVLVKVIAKGYVDICRLLLNHGVVVDEDAMDLVAYMRHDELHNMLQLHMS